MSSPSVLVIHRALAPYRIDFFNRLYQSTACDLYFEYPVPMEQSFDKGGMLARIRFPYAWLSGAYCRRLPNLRRGIKQLLTQKNYSLVFCSEFNLLTWQILYYRRRYRLGFRVVVMCDDNATVAQRVVRGKAPLLKKLLLSRVDDLLLCSTRAAEIYAEKIGMPHRQLYMPILQDDDYLRSSAQRGLQANPTLRAQWLSRSGARRLLLYVGRLSPEKNLECLIEQWAGWRKKEPELAAEWQLLMVGNGPCQNSLHLLAEQCGAGSSIQWAGKQEGDALNALFAVADALILPSTRELFGSVVGESLALGTPVACSRVAGAAELLRDGDNGIVFDPTDEGVYTALGRLPSLVSGEKYPLSNTLLSFSFSDYFAHLEASIQEFIPTYPKK